jgi:hypothetical protein
MKYGIWREKLKNLYFNNLLRYFPKVSQRIKDLERLSSKPKDKETKLQHACLCLSLCNNSATRKHVQTKFYTARLLVIFRTPSHLFFQNSLSLQRKACICVFSHTYFEKILSASKKSFMPTCNKLNLSLHKPHSHILRFKSVCWMLKFDFVGKILSRCFEVFLSLLLDRWIVLSLYCVWGEPGVLAIDMGEDIKRPRYFNPV